MDQAAKKDNRSRSDRHFRGPNKSLEVHGSEWGPKSKEAGQFNKNTEARTHWQEREGLSNALLAL